MPIITAHHDKAADRVIGALQTIFTMDKSLESDIRNFVLAPHIAKRSDTFKRLSHADALASRLVAENGPEKRSVKLGPKLRKRALDSIVSCLQRGNSKAELKTLMAEALKKLPDFSTMNSDAEVESAFSRWLDEIGSCQLAR